ncbi:MAG: hypothetical protein ACOYXO_17035 [Chloroflexota bacterium]
MAVIQQIHLSSRREVRDFLQLPYRLYRFTPQWVPPLQADIRQMLDPRRHPFYRHSQAAFFLARRQAHQPPVARLAVLIHRPYNQHNHEQTAFFYLFEAENDLESVRQLFSAGERWAIEQGANRMFGPKGFTPFDAMGLLVKGFEHRPAFGIPYNPPYYAALLESCGYQPGEDILSGYLSGNAEFPPQIHRIAEKVMQKRGFQVAQLRSRTDLRRLIPRLSEMYNRAIMDTPGNAPIDSVEIEAILRQVLFFADLKLVKILLKGDQPVGFLLAYPDISGALQRTGGRMWPLGWLDWWLELKRTPWLNINGMGIVEEYRGLGGTAILFSEMHKSIQSGRFQHVEIVQIGAENERMLRELRDLGVDFYKVHRMYHKQIAASVV